MIEPNTQQIAAEWAETLAEARRHDWHIAPFDDSPQEGRSIFDNENRPLTDGNGNYWSVAAPPQD